ncbi:hypothetical protein [Sphingomicrobium aestuariivivum]|uniref:hypothetical protein n=1 Tax=Sphingomicrobium aestuariivivum TaxID=1582356 RepID=UPI001FD68D31|nr:hypothetical protein [Sphingomicrobium aestuariivivum]MCJ8191306.1 hypothetical protein [Sphingomicrobium aestuariivivum]
MPSFTPRMGRGAARILTALLALYLLVLAIGLATMVPGRPIGEPWFTLMELLILALLPALLVQFEALAQNGQESDPIKRRLLRIGAWGTAILTGTLHHAIITTPTAQRARQGLDFEWPSLAYWTDIIAWDGFFALAMVAAATTIDRSRQLLRRLFLFGGLLALAGWLGPLTGSMQVRNIGIIGYGPIFLIATSMLARRFEGETP